MGSEREEIRARMVQIRKDTGLTQELFVTRLNDAARQLYGDAAKRYRQDTLSKIERPHGQAPTFDDVAIWAMVDPKRRGKLWLVWDETEDVTMRPQIEEIAASEFPDARTPRRRRPAREQGA